MAVTDGLGEESGNDATAEGEGGGDWPGADGAGLLKYTADPIRPTAATSDTAQTAVRAGLPIAAGLIFVDAPSAPVVRSLRSGSAEP